MYTGRRVAGRNKKRYGQKQNQDKRRYELPFVHEFFTETAGSLHDARAQ